MGNSCCNGRAKRPVNHVPRSVFVNVITPLDQWPGDPRSNSKKEHEKGKSDTDSASLAVYRDKKTNAGKIFTSLRNMIIHMASPSFSKSEIMDQYKAFMKMQNQLVDIIEDLEKSSDYNLGGKLIKQAEIVEKFTSCIGDTYTVNYVPSDPREDENKSTTAASKTTTTSNDREDGRNEHTERAVKRERICYFDFFNVDPSTLSTLKTGMKRVPDACVVFDPRYRSYLKKETEIRDVPFPGDDTAPPLPCCGGSNRMYVKYTLYRDRDGSNPDKTLYLYMDPKDEEK
eukprot:g2507.t1